MGLNDWNPDFLVVGLSHSPCFLCKVTQATETQARVAAAELGGACSVTTPVPEWPPEPTVSPRKAVSRSRGIVWAGNRHVGRKQPSRAAPDISGGSRHWGGGHSGLLIPKKHDSTSSWWPVSPSSLHLQLIAVDRATRCMVSQAQGAHKWPREPEEGTGSLGKARRAGFSRSE